MEPLHDNERLELAASSLADFIDPRLRQTPLVRASQRR
jgi:hypothetical protein